MRANFHYWGDLFALAKRCTTAGDKLLVFLKPPGWRPAYLGGPVVPHDHDRGSYRKFDTPDDVMVRRYVAIQFTILLAVTTVFLFTHEQLPAWSERALAGLIVLWVMDMGLLLEGRRSGVMLESARIIASVAVGIALCVTTWLWAWFPVVLFTGVASMIHLAVLFKENTEAE